MCVLEWSLFSLLLQGKVLSLDSDGFNKTTAGNRRGVQLLQVLFAHNYGKKRAVIFVETIRYLWNIGSNHEKFSPPCLHRASMALWTPSTRTQVAFRGD
jgi:hypothetical protein